MTLRANRAMRSTLRADGTIEIEVIEAAMLQPDDDGVVVEMLAAPIHPADMSLLFARADPATGERVTHADRSLTLLRSTEAAARAQESRIDLPMPVGMEGSGRVVATGSKAEARALLGRTVAVRGEGVYAHFTKAALRDVLLLPDDVSPAEGAAAFINPLTALGMIDVMRDEGFTALVHTAAASSLGQMLCRISQEDGIGLVNIVRRAEQVDLLRSLGAEHVCLSGAEDFEDDLLRSLRATGATLAFDAIGGGDLVSRILHLMERAAPKPAGYQHYGSAVRKKVCIYGTLDPTPIRLLKNYGLAWEIGGYLVFHYLSRIGDDRLHALKRRIADGLKTTFATHFGRTISLQEACDPEVLRAAAGRATGEKYLIDFMK